MMLGKSHHLLVLLHKLGIDKNIPKLITVQIETQAYFTRIANYVKLKEEERS